MQGVPGHDGRWRQQQQAAHQQRHADLDDLNHRREAQPLQRLRRRSAQRLRSRRTRPAGRTRRDLVVRRLLGNVRRLPAGARVPELPGEVRGLSQVLSPELPRAGAGQAQPRALEMPALSDHSSAAREWQEGSGR